MQHNTVSDILAKANDFDLVDGTFVKIGIVRTGVDASQ